VKGTNMKLLGGRTTTGT